MKREQSKGSVVPAGVFLRRPMYNLKARAEQGRDLLQLSLKRQENISTGAK
jgi:hypothetical protein